MRQPYRAPYGAILFMRLKLSLLLPENPLPNIERAIQELDAIGFARGEELHHVSVYESHFSEVYCSLLSGTLDVKLQFSQVLRLDSTAEPQRSNLPIRKLIDSQH